LNFQDRIKLWVATQSLNLPPQKLTITICSFNPESQASKKTYRWSKQQHQNVQRKLKLALTNIQSDSQTKEVQLESLNVELLTLLDIDDIEEVPI
jgi:hypothetical protein